jgi:hypothetical protein
MIFPLKGSLLRTSYCCIHLIIEIFQVYLNIHNSLSYSKSYKNISITALFKKYQSVIGYSEDLQTNFNNRLKYI